MGRSVCLTGGRVIGPFTCDPAASAEAAAPHRITAARPQASDASEYDPSPNAATNAFEHDTSTGAAKDPRYDVQAIAPSDAVQHQTTIQTAAPTT